MGGQSVTVSDVLTSSSTTYALSANMGKYLKSLVDAKGSGTVTSVALASGTGITVNSTTAITTSGTRSYSLNTTYTDTRYPRRDVYYVNIGLTI